MFTDAERSDRLAAVVGPTGENGRLGAGTVRFAYSDRPSYLISNAPVVPSSPFPFFWQIVQEKLAKPSLLGRSSDESDDTSDPP